MFNGNACLGFMGFFVFICFIWLRHFPVGAIKPFVHKQKQTWNEVENASCYTKSKYMLHMLLFILRPLMFVFSRMQ